MRALGASNEGQTTVEFALAIILLLVIVMGLFDLARAVWYSDTLALATREGARYAIVNGSDAPGGPASESTIISKGVTPHLTGVTGVNTTVSWCKSDPCSPSATPDPGATDPGDFVTVTATTVYTPLASYFAGGGLHITLRGSTTMIIQQ